MPAIASRIKDIESKYYVALRFSIHRNLGTIIAANPSTILAMARLGDREKETLIRDLADGTHRPRAGTFPRRSAGPCAIRSGGAARAWPASSNGSSHGPAGCCPGITGPTSQFLSNWMGGHDAGLPSRLSRVLRRYAGARRRPDRLGRADDDPHRRWHAGRRARYPPPLFRVHPRRAGREPPSPRRSKPPT